MFWIWVSPCSRELCLTNMIQCDTNSLLRVHMYKALKGNSNSKVLELFRGLLGAFLGLLRLSWEASGSQKPKKNLWFFEVFENVTFWACIRPYEDILKTSSK